jgi:hypothetical protein
MLLRLCRIVPCTFPPLPNCVRNFP